MTEQELRIARLSKIMNSGLRVTTGNQKAHSEAYKRVISTLEQSLEDEKIFNHLHEKKQKLVEKAEREQENLRESIRRHHFAVLQKQIEEKKRTKQIFDREVITEQELGEETFKPQNVKIKEMLDQQVEEKKRILQDIKDKEDALDRLRLDLARKSLESEMRNKSEGKQKLQNQLRESWDKTQTTNKLQKAIDRLRRFGDNYVIESEEDEEYEKKEKENEVLKRFDRVLGKKNRVGGEEKEVRLSTGLTKERSKSVLSRMSKESKKAVIDKLDKLKEEQEKISKEKIEILSFLESKSQSKKSTRPITVASLMNKTVNSRAINSFES